MASREGGREARPFFGNVASSSIAVRFLDALRAAIQSVRGLHSPKDQWQAGHGKDEAAAALSKVVTYEEFIAAPDGTYASSEFAKGRKAQSEEMLETAKRMDGLISPVKDVGAVLAKSDTTVMEQAAIKEERQTAITRSKPGTSWE